MVVRPATWPFAAAATASRPLRRDVLPVSDITVTNAALYNDYTISPHRCDAQTVQIAPGLYEARRGLVLISHLAVPVLPPSQEAGLIAQNDFVARKIQRPWGNVYFYTARGVQGSVSYTGTILIIAMYMHVYACVCVCMCMIHV